MYIKFREVWKCRFLDMGAAREQDKQRELHNGAK